MRRCIGVLSSVYYKEDGIRISNSPLYHAPDLCPFWEGDTIGDCETKCYMLRATSRPCVEAALHHWSNLRKEREAMREVAFYLHK